MRIPSRRSYRHSLLLKACLSILWIPGDGVAGGRSDGIMLPQDPKATFLPFPRAQPGAPCDTLSVQGLGALDGEYSLVDEVVHSVGKPRWIRVIPSGPPFLLSWLRAMGVWTIGTRGSGRYNAFLRDKSNTPPQSSSSWEIFDSLSASFKETGTAVDILCPACEVVTVSALEEGQASCNGAYHRRFDPGSSSCGISSWTHVAHERCILYHDEVGRAIVTQSHPRDLCAATDTAHLLQDRGAKNCTCLSSWWNDLVTDSKTTIDERAEARCSSTGRLTRVVFRLREVHRVDHELEAKIPPKIMLPRFELMSPEDGAVVSAEQATVHLSISIDSRLRRVGHEGGEHGVTQRQESELLSTPSSLQTRVTVDGLTLPTMALESAAIEGIVVSLKGLEGTNVIEMCVAEIEPVAAAPSSTTASSEGTTRGACLAEGTAIVEIFSSETHIMHRRRSLMVDRMPSDDLISHLVDKQNGKAREAGATTNNARQVLFIIDLEVVDGFKLSTLQLMKHLPDGIIYASTLDLSCASGHLPMKQLLDAEKIPLKRVCIQLPRKIWEQAQRDRGGINGHLYSVLSRANGWIEFEGRHPEVATSLRAVYAHLGNFDALVMSNGAKDDDAYLLHLARLAGVRSRIVNLGALTGGYTSPFHDGATGLVAPSQYAAHRSAADRTGLGLSIKVCPPVIDVESISRAGFSCSGDPETSRGVIFIMVSRLATAKTPGVFLRAMGTLRRRQRERNDREVEGVLVGKGPLLEHMEALSRDVDAGVRFTGFVQPGAVPCEIVQAAALVVPSFSSETYGMVIPEAMILGVPVVTFGFGGTGELLRHMENGIVVSEPTPRRLADALQLLAEDRALRDRLGAQARKDAARTLSLTRMMTCHVDAMA